MTPVSIRIVRSCRDVRRRADGRWAVVATVPAWSASAGGAGAWRRLAIQALADPGHGLVEALLRRHAVIGILDEIENDRIAVMIKVHHSLIDGASGVDDLIVHETIPMAKTLVAIRTRPPADRDTGAR